MSAKEMEKTTKEELHNLYSSHCIIMVIKPGRNRWVGHIGQTGKQEVHTKLMENIDDRGHFIYLDTERIILKCTNGLQNCDLH